MPRKKRDYENEIPDMIDLDEQPDYSVLLAESDSIRAKAALDVQKYHAARETIERVRRVNEMLRAASAG